ncbi:sensor histidine kinase [Jidongwangia harbinensis]|uniref:sensor histidine kinase n=1 Tax=Jidongwangia harbinensis TaxID=2878561 RepID=UPI001CDA0B7C|nr:histidine kinase [Jidongwangia harbinensis]MCA2215331.1 histidine kinase [Jidongwangia harbinensis]
MHFIGRIAISVGLAAVWIAGLSLYFTLTRGGGWLPLAVTTVGCLALVFRRGHAVLPWLISLGGTVLLAWEHLLWPVTATMSQLALAHLVSVRGRRTTVAAAATTFAAHWLCLVWQRPVDDFWFLSAGLLVWTVGSVCIGTAFRFRREHVTGMEERARWALESREAEARRRVTEDRLRIARELHDVLGHQMAVIRVHAGLARRTLTTDPAKAAAALSETETAAQAVLREMTGILRLLREPDADPTTAPAPGLDDLDKLIDEVRRNGLTVTVAQQVDAGRVSRLVGVTAYRVVQECLTNAGRHSTGAVELSLRTEPEVLVIEATNPLPAPGRTPPGGGFGLIGMRERVRAVGGRLTAAGSGGFFRVRAALPLTAGVDLEAQQ